MTHRFFDDFRAGQTYPGQSRTLDGFAFTLFAQLTGDAHPLHFDGDYTSHTAFGEPVAHGLMLMALTTLCATALSRRLDASMVAIVEQGCRFFRSVGVGETVHTDFEVQEARLTRSSDVGLVRFMVRVRNVSGQVLLKGPPRLSGQAQAGVNRHWMPAPRQGSL